MSNHFSRFNSRRSTVYSTKGIVSSPQFLANSAGVKILELGGNCVDAAIAVSAALCITEPASTGIGGDCFALYFKSTDGKVVEVLGLNGSGRSAKDLCIQDVYDLYGDVVRIPSNSPLAITVPGAVAGWQDAYEKWGSKNVTFAQILQPAIELAEDGYPLAEISSKLWQEKEDKLLQQNPGFAENPFLINGKTPSEGDLVYNKSVAETLKLIAKDGKRAFYEGPVAKAIVDTVGERSHKLTLADLKDHKSEFVVPIKYNFQGRDVWEIPPNGHGIVALLALGIIQELHNSKVIDLHTLKHNSVEYLHILVEALKIAFYDSDEYVTDFKHIPVEDLLSSEYLLTRAKLFHKDKVIDGHTMKHGVPDPKYKSDTVYLTVSDASGEACSFINSVFSSFGTGIVVKDHGFCLQNRGSAFNLIPGSSNSLEGGKRPYHTIIPAMITNNDGSLYASFGNMGGYGQPSSHVQHVLNLTLFNMTPQQLTDSPRFVLGPGDPATDRGRGANGPVCTPITMVYLEEGISDEIVAGLSNLGHATESVHGYERSMFGRAQIIKKEFQGDRFVYSGGSDLRGDGASVAII